MRKYAKNMQLNAKYVGVDEIYMQNMQKITLPTLLMARSSMVDRRNNWE